MFLTYRYPNYRYGYGHLNSYGYYGHPYGLGYGYGHYGKRSASRDPNPKSVAPYLHYDLGRKLGYFAYRGYPQVRSMRVFTSPSKDFKGKLSWAKVRLLGCVIWPRG